MKKTIKKKKTPLYFLKNFPIEANYKLDESFKYYKQLLIIYFS